VRRGGRLAAIVAAVALAAAAAVAVPGNAAAQGQEEPPFVDWNPLLPGLAQPFHSSRERDCADGSPACVEETLSQMYRRFDRLYVTCDHNSAFGITYIRVTEEIRKAVLAGFYEEPGFLWHEDRVFARMYFESYDAWTSGRREKVPPAWREAYDAGRDRSVNGTGNLLMSMNAHINRDFPFLLDALGLVKPDGSSRKVDHDRGNRVLNRLYNPVLKELAARYDPSVGNTNVPGVSADDTAVFQILQGWREDVWRNAERLAAADTLGQRKAQADYIEQYALGVGRQIKAATAIDDSSARDAHCAAYRRTHRERGGLARATRRKRPLRVSGRRARAVRLRVACPEPVRDCAGTVALSRAKKRLARQASFTLPAGESRVVRLKLTRAGRRIAGLKGGRRVRVRTASPSPWGTTRTASVRLRLLR
jgi:Family of unknown function (DUF5995)